MTLKDRVFLPSKITNRTDRESVLEKLRMIDIIKEKHTYDMRKPPIITSKERAKILRPYSVKPARPTPVLSNLPKSIEDVSFKTRSNLIRSFKLAGTKVTSRDGFL